MSKGDKIATVCGVIILIIVSFVLGMSFQSFKCIGYLANGVKFVNVNGNTQNYILGESIWIEKLPNGFYKLQ